jgi:hypothetical protein
MTTSSMARPTTGAGPTPGDHKHVTDNRTYQRALNAIQKERVKRDPTTYEYIDTHPHGRIDDIDTIVYELADRKHVALTFDGGIKVTAEGEAWLARPRRAGRPPQAVQVKFSSVEAGTR